MHSGQLPITLLMALALSGAVVSMDVSMATCVTPCDCYHDDRGNFIIDCSDKMLEHLPNFKNVTGIRIHKLYFDMNRLKSIPDSAFAGLEIEEINLSFNPLVNVSPLAFQGLESSLVNLVLRQTELKTPLKAFLGGLNNLKFLDLSDLGSTLLQNITRDTFPEFPALEDLNIIYSKVRHIEPHSFDGMKSLLYLDLEENSLTSIPPGLGSLKKLKELDVSINQITNVKTGDFDGLDNLEIIKLHSNTGLKIEADSFQSCANTLQSLQLKWTDLEAVPVHSFHNLKQLTHLDLSGNLIEEIAPGSFSSLDSLTELDLSENFGLQLPDDGAFDGVADTLRTLRLTSTNMESVPTKALQALGNLEKVVLSGNKIAEVSNLSSIHAVNFDLSRNNIGKVHPNKFIAKAPIVLDLSYNVITKTDFITEPCEYFELFLNGNPDLNCSCELLTAAMKEGVSIRGSCGLPRELSGLYIQSAAAINYTKMNCGYSNDELNGVCTWVEEARPITGAANVPYGHQVYSIIMSILVLLTDLSLQGSWF